MTQRICLLILYLGCCLPVMQAPDFPSKPSTGTVRNCRIIRAIDGDTLEIEVYHIERIRLLQCWAPEIHETGDPTEKPRGLASKAHLELVAKPRAEGIVFIPSGPDHSKTMTLNRYLGHVWLDGMDVGLSQYQVEAGHAKRSK